jgi:S-adenosylmethionine synthetase
LLSTFQLVSSLCEQSPDISQSVGKGTSLAAGDQGMMYGYACDETPSLMPRSYEIARGIVEAIRDNHMKYPFLGPDGKTQVSINPREKSSGSIVLSWQHSATVSLEEVQNALRSCSEEVLQKYDFSPEIFLINPSGRFVLGGPFADTGLTGRKQIVDSYGGSVPHGGGAYSGKDATKVDRSGAYMARWVAKHVVASGLAERCLVQLIFSIGRNNPLHIELDCFNTEKATLESIRKGVLTTFDFSVEGIIQDLQLRLPVFRKTASYGHFGRDDFSWEALTRLEKLLSTIT